MKPQNAHSKAISATEAARILGVRRTTLYTYVSRGWLQSLPGRNRRERRYLRSEVEALRDRAEAGKGHKAVATRAIGWGHPVIDTAISAFTPDGPAYRGVLARDLIPRGFDATCAHLWGLPALPRAHAPWQPAPAHPTPIPRLAAVVAQVGLEPPTSPAAFLRRCALSLVPPDRARAATTSPTIAGIVALALDAPVEPIDAALVWCADHGLNASTFAARVAASTGAALPAVVGAGLAALSGPGHGTASVAVQAFLHDVATECTDGWGPELATREVVSRLHAAGLAPPSLGHPLYPGGDPRGTDLLARARALAGGRFVGVVADTLASLGSPPPDLDFGLVALCRALALPDHAPPTLFAIGRMAGWIAHMHEERSRGQLIRPRSRYIGPPIR